MRTPSIIDEGALRDELVDRRMLGGAGLCGRRFGVAPCASCRAAIALLEGEFADGRMLSVNRLSPANSAR